jgi:ribosomal protein S18 acetylase RimI-like enzyme
MILARLIVHPAYWRRGIGKRLVKWGLELAQYDRVKAGVSTEPRNDALAMYLSLGFVKMRERWIEDLQNPPNKVGISLLECSFD